MFNLDKYVGDREALLELQEILGGQINALILERDALVKALRDILAANDEFRAGMPDEWDGDPLQDACEAARVLVGQQSND
jgi:hypothetical protein